MKLLSTVTNTSADLESIITSGGEVMVGAIAEMFKPLIPLAIQGGLIGLVLYAALLLIKTVMKALDTAVMNKIGGKSGGSGRSGKKRMVGYVGKGGKMRWV
jgi:hypothetical protein